MYTISIRLVSDVIDEVEKELKYAGKYWRVGEHHYELSRCLTRSEHKADDSEDATIL
jgi:hypothetical protein